VRGQQDDAELGKVGPDLTSGPRPLVGWQADVDHPPAFHVAAFWKRPDPVLSLAARLLASTGSLYLFNETPSWSRRGTSDAFADHLAAVLSDNDYRVEDAAFTQPPLPPAVCVIARPSQSP